MPEQYTPHIWFLTNCSQFFSYKKPKSFAIHHGRVRRVDGCNKAYYTRLVFNTAAAPAVAPTTKLQMLRHKAVPYGENELLEPGISQHAPQKKKVPESPRYTEQPQEGGGGVHSVTPLRFGTFAPQRPRTRPTESQ